MHAHSNQIPNKQNTHPVLAPTGYILLIAGIVYIICKLELQSASANICNTVPHIL